MTEYLALVVRIWWLVVTGIALGLIALVDAVTGWGNVSRWAIAALVSLVVAQALTGRQLIEERAEARIRPGARIDEVLRKTQNVRERLRFHGEPENDQRLAVMEIRAEALTVVQDFAPAYTDDLRIEPPPGAGREQLLSLVNEYNRVLSDVRKQVRD